MIAAFAFDRNGDLGVTGIRRYPPEDKVLQGVARQILDILPPEEPLTTIDPRMIRLAEESVNRMARISAERIRARRNGYADAESGASFLLP